MYTKSSKLVFLGILVILLAVSCGTPAPTKVVVITSAPIIITATEPLVTPTPIVIVVTATDLPKTPTSTPLPSTDNLDRYAQDWKIFVEGKPIAEVKGAANPSLDGESLQCSNKGGDPYSNVHCYLNLPPEPNASSFVLSMSFWFTPATTCNNRDGTASTIQALEFTMNKWSNSKRYEFAVQWQNVGNGAPQWMYWDPFQDETKKWVPINSNVTQCLEGDKWHTLQLEGTTAGNQVRYQKLTIDNQTYDLNFTTARVSTPGEVDRLAIAIQLDGNANQTPYDVYIDKVNFTRQGNATNAPTPIPDCSTAKIDELPANNGYVDKNTVIKWTPSSCVMNVQLYQDGKLLRENQVGDASGIVSMKDLPSGSIEIKIWTPGAGAPSDSRIIQTQ